MRLGKILVVASLLAAAGSGLYAQTKTTPTPPPAKPGTAKAPAKTSTKKAAPKATPGTPAAAPAESEQKVARRDPFESLTSRQDAAAKNAANLPPGKPGLQIGTLRLDGIVKAPNGMIAVVTNPQSRTYFLRDGDQLYDGRVEKIGMDSVSFHEIGKDAFGKPVERQVNKRIYSSAGEQQ
jgi:type IV pilus assembly protein PilP